MNKIIQWLLMAKINLVITLFVCICSSPSVFAGNILSATGQINPNDTVLNARKYLERTFRTIEPFIAVCQDFVREVKDEVELNSEMKSEMCAFRALLSQVKRNKSLSGKVIKKKIIDIVLVRMQGPIKKDLKSLGKPGELGFGVAVAVSIPQGFTKLRGTENIFSPQYGNYRHIDTNGDYVCIPAFAYRVGKNASPALYSQYGDHALELKWIDAFDLAGSISASDVKEELWAQGNWLLDRAFVNAGKVQAEFLVQKYLASPLDNKRVTSRPHTVPVSLSLDRCNTRSSSMYGCHGEISDAITLANSTDSSQHVTSIFQYGALTKIAVAEAQV